MLYVAFGTERIHGYGIYTHLSFVVIDMAGRARPRHYPEANLATLGCNRSLHNLNITDAIPSNIALQRCKGTGGWFEGKDATLRKDFGQIYTQKAYVGTNVKDGAALNGTIP
jgi:hypothetical protein